MTSKAQEAKWRAEDDAQTLMRMQEITADKKRHAAAKKELVRKAQEAMRALGMGGNSAKFKKGMKAAFPKD